MAGWRNLWQTRWSQKPVVPGSNPGPATKFQASGGMVYAARSKRAVFGHCGFDSHLAYQVAPRLPMVRRTVSKAVARGSNPRRGAKAPERKVEERPGCNPGFSRFDAGPVLQIFSARAAAVSRGRVHAEGMGKWRPTGLENRRPTGHGSSNLLPSAKI